jgi:hypothetical protein
VTALGVQARPAAALEAPAAFTSVALPTWQTNGIAWATATSGGLVFVGGTFSKIRPPGAAAGTSEQARTNLAVLDAATGAPTSCAIPVVGSDIRALTVSPDGATLYVGGTFTSVGGEAHKNLAAISIASCAPVSGFVPTVDLTVRAVAATASSVYVGGDLGVVNGATRHRAAAVSAATGALLPWAPSYDGIVRAIALKPDSSAVVVGGSYWTANSVVSPGISVVNPTSGANSKTFPNGFFPTTSTSVQVITVDATGFYTGNEGNGVGRFDGRTAVDWNGWTKRWQDTCLGATQSLASYAGVLYSGSHAHDCSSMGWFPDGPRHHLLAEATTDQAITSWFPDTDDGIGQGIGPRGMVVAHSGTDYLWTVGEFVSVNGVPQQGITRFGQGTDTAAPTTPTPSITSFTAGQAYVAWRPSLDTDDATLTYQVFRDGSSTALTTVTSKAMFWDRAELDHLDTGLAPGSTHSYRVTATDGTNTVTSAAYSVTIAGTSSAYAARAIADGAAPLLRYDEGSDVFLADSSSHRRSAELLGSATFRVNPGAVAGDASKAMTLTGTTSYLYTVTRAPAPTTYTEETWFNTTTTTGGVLLSFGEKQALPSAHPDKQVFMKAAGNLSFGVMNGTTPTVITSPATYNDGTWHHLAATQGSDGMRLYVDGSQVASSATATSLTSAGYWRIGSDNATPFPGHPTDTTFNGSIDETAFYPTALTAAQVTAHAGTTGGTTSVSLTPTSDTFANAGAPSTTYAASTVLSSRGSPGAVTYLRFVLPAAPSGTTLTAAGLTIHTTTDSTAGSTSTHAVTLASDAWTDTTLTWNNRPALSTALGTVSGATATNATYATVLDPSALVPGTQVTVAISSGGSDGLSLWSSNFGTVAFRPHLELTYS